jgi:hypothetical protein
MDRPHNISIVFSLFATLLSAVSLWQSCESVKFTKASSRADVEITQIQLRLPALPPDFWKHPDIGAFYVNNPTVMEGTIANFGKTRATNIKIIGELRQWDSRTNSLNVFEPITVPDLAPTRTQSAYIPLHFSQNPVPENARISGFVDYTDETTATRYHESWCYQSKGRTQAVSELSFCSEASPKPPPPPQGK